MIYEARQVLLASARRAYVDSGMLMAAAAGTQPVDASAIVLIDLITEHVYNYVKKLGPWNLSWAAVWWAMTAFMYEGRPKCS